MPSAAKMYCVTFTHLPRGARKKRRTILWVAATSTEEALDRAQAHDDSYLRRQHPEGVWNVEYESDSPVVQAYTHTVG